MFTLAIPKETLDTFLGFCPGVDDWVEEAYENAVYFGGRVPDIGEITAAVVYHIEDDMTSEEADEMVRTGEFKQFGYNENTISEFFEAVYDGEIKDERFKVEVEYSFVYDRIRAFLLYVGCPFEEDDKLYNDPIVGVW